MIQKGRPAGNYTIKPAMKISPFPNPLKQLRNPDLLKFPVNLFHILIDQVVHHTGIFFCHIDTGMAQHL